MFIFEVIGPPIPQQQTRFMCKGGFARTWDPSKKDKERIQWQIRPYAPKEPLRGAIELTLVFFMPIPKSTPSKIRKGMINRVIMHVKRPDEDNLAYLVTNALKELVYRDDSQICAKHVYKFYAEQPKTVIKVREILQLDPLGYTESDI